MDVYCPVCGEPWEIDTFHDVAEEQARKFRDVVDEFARVGCVATGWVSPDRCTARENARADMARALFDVMGDDIDGVASMLEDFDDLFDGGEW